MDVMIVLPELEELKKEAERLRTEQNHTHIRLKHVATATAFFAELRYDICDSL